MCQENALIPPLPLNLPTCQSSLHIHLPALLIEAQRQHLHAAMDHNVLDRKPAVAQPKPLADDKLDDAAITPALHKLEPSARCVIQFLLDQAENPDIKHGRYCHFILSPDDFHTLEANCPRLLKEYIHARSYSHLVCCLVLRLHARLEVCFLAIENLGNFAHRSVYEAVAVAAPTQSMFAAALVRNRDGPHTLRYGSRRRVYNEQYGVEETYADASREIMFAPSAPSTSDEAIPACKIQFS